jgi:hypothetical protein
MQRVSQEIYFSLRLLSCLENYNITASNKSFKRFFYSREKSLLSLFFFKSTSFFALGIASVCKVGEHGQPFYRLLIRLKANYWAKL